MSGGRARLLGAVRHEQVDATPVWFMRQAGRSLPPYRELRRRWGLMEMVHQPELCAEVTCMPVEVLGVDAAVLFADIMLPLEGMGVPFELREEVGPWVDDPIRSAEQVRGLRRPAAEEAYPFLLQGIRIARERLGERAGLIGFGPSPFTLACYLVEGHGSRDYPALRGLLRTDPAVFAQLLATLTDHLGDYLVAQAEAGCEVVQVFDSWVGVLDERSFREHLLPHLQGLFGRLRGKVPAIYFSTASSHLLPAFSALGAAGISVDWRVPLDTAWDTVGAEHFLQGNLDPAALLAPWDRLRPLAEDVLARARGRRGHVFNLGHGVLPNTEPDQLQRLVELVHEFPGPDGRRLPT